MIPYRLHTMPSNESMRLPWANTLNRKSLSKQVFACSEHFLDGKPTERNPNSGDAVSTSSGHKTEHLPEAICEFNVLEPSSVSARKHNTNIPIFWEEMITHTRNQTTFTITLTKILSMDEKGVQVRQYSDRLRLFVVYRGNERDIFYFG